MRYISSVEEGIEIRIVSRSFEEVEKVGNLISSVIKKELSPREFYDSGTILSPNKKYDGFMRKLRFKLKEKDS